MSEKPLTVAQVAERENCSAKTVLRAIARGDLDAWNIGDPAARRPTWRMTGEAVDAWRELARGRRQPTPQPVMVRPVTPEPARPARKRPTGTLERGRARVTPDMGRRTAA